MNSPFPGMDPYLESTLMWPDVHNRLTFAICDQIQPALSPRYLAVITPYVTTESIEIAQPRIIVPDVAVYRQQTSADHPVATAIAPAPLTGIVALDVPAQYRHIEIRSVGDETLVTSIEILSPVNKRAGANAADAYERKRQDVLHSPVHLLEIDLLRAGRRPLLETALPDAPYFIFLSRAERRPHVDIWPVALQSSVPVVPIPLQAPDLDIPLDLNRALQQIYASARYDLRVDYTQAPPPPALSAADATWLNDHLRAAGRRV